MSLDYGNLLSRAWQITWKHKVLWIFGILAGLGNSGGPPGDGNAGDRGAQSNGSELVPPQFEQWANQIDQAAIVAIVIGLLCLALVIAVVLIALQVIGRGGLIGGVLRADAGQSVTFGEAWGVGVSKFWTLFLIGLIPGLVSLLLALLVIAPGIVFSVLTFGLGFLCFIPLFCVLAIVGVILNIIAYFGQIAAVVENLGVMDALRRAWALITANVGQIIVLGLIVFFISFVVSLIIGLPFLLTIVPAVIAVVGFANESQAVGYSGLAFALVCCALYLPVLIVASGILQTWLTAAWTLAYKRLTQASAPGGQPAPQFSA
jgi:hypothetical protein